MERSIAEGPDATPRAHVRRRSAPAVVAGALVVLAALGVYLASNPERANLYNHFVWQADAFLQGRAWFPHPVPEGSVLPRNDYLQDVYPLVDAAGRETGRALIPFPPLPALVLLPLVAVQGLAADQGLVAILLAALGTGIAWWSVGPLGLRTGPRVAGTLVLAFGTAWWWAAAVGSTWYLAHLVAADLALLAVGVALRADPRAADETIGDEDDRVRAELDAAGRRGLAGLAASAWPLDRRQVLAGLLLGLGATARLPLVFAAPFLVLVGGGGSRPRRILSAAVGAFPPVAILLAYTYATTGSFLHPGYERQYLLEALGYPTLGYDVEWAVEDVRYIPQNLRIMFARLPHILPQVLPDELGFSPPVLLCTEPGAGRGLFDPACPFALPDAVGTSILLSAPGLLLVLPALRRIGSSRLAAGSITAAVVVGLFNLAHFSQGWVQWGYRFSLDFIPFLLPLVVVGAARADGRARLAAWAVVGVGSAINLWGVAWGRILGW